MLTDSEIELLCSRMGIPLETICFKDEIPSPIKYNRSYFVNMESSVDQDGTANCGSHWCCFQVNKYQNGRIEPIWFDPYGVSPPEDVKKYILEQTGQKLPFTEKDIQSLLNNACGYFCCAYLHFINHCDIRSKDLYLDTAAFLDMFDDLNKSVDFKKNEYILKLFFQSKDPALRKEINIDGIMGEDHKGGGDIGKGATEKF